MHFAPTTDPGERLKALKEYLRLEREMLLRYHQKGDGGVRVAMARSIMIDVLLDKLFQFAIEAYFHQFNAAPPEVALVALGGYGREELCPLSDIDLMFLFSKKAKKADIEPIQNLLVDQILYPLWDLGLKVGYSIRTVNEAMAEAKAEDQSKNAFLESRLVVGSEAVYAEFEKTFNKLRNREDSRPYVKQRLEDQRKRREKNGNSVFVQEPDIKNGVGGLRDFQSILWMARFRLGIGTLEELERRAYLTATDRKLLQQAYDFLLRVRIELHFQSKRPTDVLDIEKQPEIAWALGYRQKDLFRRVEAFMRDYYQHAQWIYLLSKRLEHRLSIIEAQSSSRIPFRAVVESRRLDLQRYQDGFILGRNVLSFEHPHIFEQEPARLIRVFRYMQQYNATIDIDLGILISESANLMTPLVAEDEATKKTFRAILQSKGQVHDALLAMHEMGVLARFLPEFGALSCLVQHEFYHRYTADIHTLETIRMLDDIFTGTAPESEHYLAQLRKTHTPALLYLVLLLHDIGKGEGTQGHMKSGARLARPILKRIGVEESLWEEIIWMIKNHLEMARFWQRLDIDDPKTATAFAESVRDPDTLRYLYVLTYCDTRGTAEGLWNSYKSTLHRALFDATMDALEDKAEATEKRYRERKAMIHRKIIEKALPDLEHDQIEAHFNLLPDRYFIHNNEAEVILHLKMIQKMLVTISESDSIGSLVPVVDWRNDADQGLTVVNVVTWDRAGLFYKLAGALTVAGVNILSTKAISRSDHITIDTFYIVNPEGGLVEDAKAESVFLKHLYAALTENVDLLPAIEEQARKVETTNRLTRDHRLKAPIPPKVEIYHELSLKRTIVEIQATDNIGLLYRIAKAIFNHGFDITFARIATERGAALDTFYIENIDGSQRDTGDLIDLREALSDIIEVEHAGLVAS